MNNIENSVYPYLKKVEAFVKEKTRQNDHYLSTISIDRKKCFFREIFYVVKNFLQEDNSNTLFIKIPVQELGIRQKEQEENWGFLQKTISDVFCLATADKQKQMVECPTLDSSAVGNVVYCHNDNSAQFTYPQFFEIVNSDLHGIPVRPKLIFDGNKYIPTPKAIEIYNQNKDCIFNMKSKPSSSDQRTMRHIESVYKKIRTYIADRFETQYGSALIVGFTDSAKRYERTYSNIYFDSPVSFTKRFSEIDIKNEIVCFIGDKKYADTWDDVQRGIGQGKIKKAIFIGSQLDEFKNIEGHRLYEFSVREIYHHFVKGSFPKINCERLHFPWLEEKLSEINTIIDEIPAIDESQRKKLITHIFWNYVGIDIEKPNEDKVNKLSDFIYENLSIGNDEEDKILDWYSHSIYDSTSPKEQYCKRIPNNKNLHIVTPFSYKQKFKQYLGNKNSDNNVIVVDTQCDSKKYVDTLTDLLMHLPLGEIVFLSYTSLYKMETHLDNEINVYNSNYRVQLLGGLQMEVEETPLEHIATNSDLSDYFVLDLLDEYLSDYSGNNNVQTKYAITFQDGTTSIMSGSVLVDKKQVPIAEICDYYDEEDFPMQITYYIQPENFSLVSEIIKNFPRGRDVAFYSSLWKETLCRYCDNEYNSDSKKMHKEQFPFLPKSMMKKYIDPNSSVDFPRTFSKLVRRMLALHLIEESTANYMMSARKANAESTALGGKLKDALFQYKATGERNEFLKDFDSKAQSRGESITSTILLTKCLITNTIINIKKQK